MKKLSFYAAAAFCALLLSAAIAPLPVSRGQTPELRVYHAPGLYDKADLWEIRVSAVPEGGAITSSGIVGPGVQRLELFGSPVSVRLYALSAGGQLVELDSADIPALGSRIFSIDAQPGAPFALALTADGPVRARVDAFQRWTGFGATQYRQERPELAGSAEFELVLAVE